MKTGDKVELIAEVLYSFNKLEKGTKGVILTCGSFLCYVKWENKEWESYVSTKDLKLIENNMQTLTRKQLITLHSQFDCTEWKTTIEELLKENVLEDKIDVSSKLELLKSKGTEEQKEAVKKLKITFPASYLELHNKCGLKVGDKVRVTRKATTHEQDWCNSWTSEMNDFVGKVFEINNDSREQGFRLYNGESRCFPYFVLEKVEEKYIPYTFEDDLVGKVIKHKTENSKNLISWINNTNVYVFGEGQITYQNLLETWTELDGSPLGKLTKIN